MQKLRAPVTLTIAMVFALPLSTPSVARAAGASPTPVQQQTAPASDFPADAQTFAADELHKRLVGKTYTYKSAGGTVRLDFRDNGYVYLNTSNGFNSSGRWKVEQSNLCSEIRNAPQGCAEMRQSGDRLFLKRLNGEVVEMLPG